MERRCLHCGVVAPPGATVCPACGSVLAERSGLAETLAPRSAAPWIPVDGGSVPDGQPHPAGPPPHAVPPPLPHAPVLHLPHHEPFVPAYVGSPTKPARGSSPLQKALIALLVIGVAGAATWGIIRLAESLTTDRAADILSPTTRPGSGQPLPWRAFTASDGSFTVDVPAEPTVATAPAPASGTAYSVTVPGLSSQLLVVVMARSGPMPTKAQLEERLAPAVESLTRSVAGNAAVRSAVVVDTPAGPALDLEATATGDTVSMRLVPTRARVYALVAVQRKADGPLVGLHWARFRDSFAPK